MGNPDMPHRPWTEWFHKQSPPDAAAGAGYVLEEKIGSGGMGEVWRARHRTLGRLAAVKRIRPDVLDLLPEHGEMARRRFEREARATACLRSPHAVTLYDFGTEADGAFYFAMELLDGMDLNALVKRDGPQPAGRVVEILRQACDALAEAHALGLVHRDIKPSNLFLCRTALDGDFVKVLDFGLAKWVHDDGRSRLTMEQATTGTPAYIAPEAALGQEVDGRADIYCLACVGYWLLTGSTVFQASQAMAMLLAHINETPQAPSRKSELPVPESLDRLILRCLAKNPAERPAGAEELARLLEECGAQPWTAARARSWWNLRRRAA
jgi:eukaryotic-like serine/threonine-protein kinase